MTRRAARAAATQTAPDDAHLPVACAHCPLRQLRAFRSGTPEEVAAVQAIREGQTAFQAGQAIVAAGVRMREVHTLLSGWAFRFRLMADGRRQILCFLLPGDLIGLQENLGDVPAFGVEALTEVWTCRFRDDDLLSLYGRHPALAHGLTWVAAHQEWIVDENLISVGRRTAQERIGMLLIHLHKRASSLGMADSTGRVPFPLSQQHVADAMGLSLVHVNKTLASLRRLGLYRLENGWLSLPQPHALQRLADYYDAVMPNRPLL